jgi:hypothetical protein
LQSNVVSVRKNVVVNKKRTGEIWKLTTMAEWAWRKNVAFLAASFNGMMITLSARNVPATRRSTTQSR